MKSKSSACQGSALICARMLTFPQANAWYAVAKAPFAILINEDDMKRLAVPAVFVLLSVFGLAQEVSRVDVFGGYSYVNADFNGVIPRQNFNGWETSVEVNANRLLAAEGDIGGYYQTITGGIAARDYVFDAGPRINVRPVFIHALAGMDHLSGSLSGVSIASQNGFAAAFGGGVQQRIAGHWAIRASADYLLTRHNIFGGPRVTQNNFRAGVGLVYGFGSMATKAKLAQPPSSAGLAVASLGIRVAPAEGRGALVTDVASGSLGEQAHLRVGDVISQVDGKHITTPAELAAELSGTPPGAKITIGYLLRGLWQTETVVVLPQQQR